MANETTHVESRVVGYIPARYPGEPLSRREIRELINLRSFRDMKRTD